MGHRDGIDRLTLIALAVVAYALANLAHEGAGHGGACLLVGGRPLALSAIHVDADEAALGVAARKWIAAGGTLANLLLGGVALAVMRARRPSPGRYFLWLLATVNLLQAAGYWLFSGIGRVGDWATVIDGLSPAAGWRAGLALVGGVAYAGAVLVSLRELRPLLGDDEDRMTRAVALTVVPYVAGGILYVAAGLLNPEGWRLVLISAAAASLGGTSALAWMAQLLRNEARFPPAAGPPLHLPRSAAWLAAGVVTALLFVAGLGPGVRF